MAAPQEIIDEIFTVIEGGKTIGESAQIIQFPSDSGSKTYDVVNMHFNSTNGTGLNYLVTAVAQGAAAISAGAIMVAVSIPEFMALAVPCLGIAVGTAWYNLDPDGWTNLADLLLDAGYTIKNKVVGFMIETGVISFPPDTIEILKEELCRLGAFDYGKDWDGDKPQSFNIVEPLVSSNKRVEVELIGTKHLMYYAGMVHDIRPSHDEILGVAFDPPVTMTDFKVTSAIINNKLYSLVCSKERINAISFYTYNIATGGFTGSGIGGDVRSYSYDGKPVYYQRGNFFSSDTMPGVSSLGSNAENFATEELLGQVAWVLQYGRFIENNHEEYQQTGAKFPQSGVPFRTTYPDWIPWEFPELVPWTIPEVMPIQYPDLLPKEEPYQDPAQNPAADPDKEAQKGLDKLNDPETNPQNDPREYPEIEPDPDPAIPEPEPLPDVPEASNPDPIKPDPDIPPSPIIPPSQLPNTVGSSRLFTVYNPSQLELGRLGAYLWDMDLIDMLRRIWQNPLDGIISLSQVFCTPSTGSPHNIILGFLDSGVSANEVVSQFATIDCGTVSIPEQKQNSTDYNPYTSMELYLPFIGITEIDTNEFMGGSIGVKYKIDVYTGTCLAEVRMIRAKDVPNGGIVYTFSGNCSQQLPLTSGDSRELIATLLSAAGAGIGIASGGALGVVGVTAGMAGAVRREMLHVSHSGNLSANAGILGHKKPYVIISRQNPYNANGYSRLYGYPANKTVYLGNCSGYTRVKAGRLQSLATQAEKDEIMEFLTDGVIM